MSWEKSTPHNLAYYEATKQRLPDPRLLQAMNHLGHPGDALDIGCGAGADSRGMVQQGFTVCAIDTNPDAILYLGDLLRTDHFRFVQTSFHMFPYRMYDLVNARYALPFTPRENFFDAWTKIKQSLRPGGMFIGQFFGDRDSWNVSGIDIGITFLTRGEAEAALDSLSVIEFTEENGDGFTELGKPKHWHVFHVIAQKSQ